MTCFMTRALTAGTAAALLLSAHATAVAQIVVEGTPLPTRIVRTSFAEMATEAGRDHVERQIRKAARDVCGKEYRLESVYFYKHRCYTVAAADGLDQMNRIATIRSAGRAATSATAIQIIVQTR